MALRGRVALRKIESRLVLKVTLTLAVLSRVLAAFRAESKSLAIGFVP